MKRRVTYRPSKASGIFGGVVGGIFILIGLFFAIPTFGVFGILWTLFAVGITGMNLYQAFGKGYTGPKIDIEDDGETAEDPEERLKKLQGLYEQRIITTEEFEEKRKEILKEL